MKVLGVFVVGVGLTWCGSVFGQVGAGVVAEVAERAGVRAELAQLEADLSSAYREALAGAKDPAERLRRKERFDRENAARFERQDQLFIELAAMSARRAEGRRRMAGAGGGDPREPEAAQARAIGEIRRTVADPVERRRRYEALDARLGAELRRQEEALAATARPEGGVRTGGSEAAPRAGAGEAELELAEVDAAIARGVRAIRRAEPDPDRRRDLFAELEALNARLFTEREQLEAAVLKETKNNKTPKRR